MQIGDRRQAAILGVVAVGAIGFVILQLAPKSAASSPPARASIPPATATPTPPAVPLRHEAASAGASSRAVPTVGDDIGSAFGGSSFGAPPNPPAPAPPLSPASGSANPNSTTAVPSNSGQMISGPMSVEGLLPSAVGGTSTPAGASKPPPPAPVAVSVRLVATVMGEAGRKPVALLTLAGSDVTLASGDPVTGPWRIGRIGEREIELRSAAAARRLTLGVETKL